ncbi:MAG: SCO family protein [Bacteroidetes bacterium SW_11_45_7]|nr:MAG: SCO family protein [Bacteroidetes bacterium SW_11_45_7]
MLRTSSKRVFSKLRKCLPAIIKPGLLFVLALWLLVLGGCSGNANQKELPYLGRDEVVEKNGQKDTIPHRIDDFRFIDQDSNVVTPSTFEDKIYVADFFFTSCPTICPTMKKQMKRVYDKYKDNRNVALLSHSIDPAHDSVPVLKEYAQDMQVSSDTWHFITGKKDSIYGIAESYMVSAKEDQSAPGGFVHSGAFILVDKNRHIRGVYDGTSRKDVNQLMKDMEVLLKEEKS